MDLNKVNESIWVPMALNEPNWDQKILNKTK